MGYTPERACRVAAADLSLDWSVATEPARGQEPTAAKQEPWWRYHAFRHQWGVEHETTDHGENEAADDTGVLQQRRHIYRQCRTAGNPGVFLHFFQDKRRT